MQPTRVELSDGSGAVERFAMLEGAGIAPRNVDVWLPPGYAADATARYPVLYMHDGQNLFDPALAYGGVDWGIDEAMTRLIEAGETRGAIVVGVWNSKIRWGDYMPEKPLATPEVTASSARFREMVGNDEPRADRYLAFLTGVLKPLIDATYRTRPGQPDTLVMGSSMGGLISLYALIEHPDTFGRAGCVSTHWPAGEEPLVDWMAAALPPPGRHRLYFDFGTEGLDADYEPLQRRMDERLRAAGYSEGHDWITRKFPGAEHSERSWRERLGLPLRFLLG